MRLNGPAIRTRREQRHLSQAALAELVRAAGVPCSQQAIADYELGARGRGRVAAGARRAGRLIDPRLPHALAGALDVPVDQLLLDPPPAPAAVSA